MKFPHGPGFHDLTWPTPNGELLRLTLHLPGQTANAPCVLALHYGGPPVGFYGRGLLETLVVPAWEELDAVCVAPVSLGGDWLAPANVAAVLALVVELEATFQTAPTRKIVTGYSLGAAGCWHLAEHRDTRFALVVPMAGAPPNRNANFTAPVHVLHSRADQLFPFAEVEAAVTHLVARGLPVSFHALDGAYHFNVGAFVPALRELAPVFNSR